jgi:hypothetical protein
MQQGNSELVKYCRIKSTSISLVNTSVCQFQHRKKAVCVCGGWGLCVCMQFYHSLPYSLRQHHSLNLELGLLETTLKSRCLDSRWEALVHCGPQQTSYHHHPQHSQASCTVGFHHVIHFSEEQVKKEVKLGVTRGPNQTLKRKWNVLSQVERGWPSEESSNVWGTVDSFKGRDNTFPIISLAFDLTLSTITKFDGIILINSVGGKNTQVEHISDSIVYKLLDNGIHTQKHLRAVMLQSLHGSCRPRRGRRRTERRL